MVIDSGTPGEMHMFIFNYTIPERDGSLANDIIVHEYTHGITNRMTGGGTARYVKFRPGRRCLAYAFVLRGSCLQTLEARGLGEGWSDAFAEYASASCWTALELTRSELLRWTEWTNATVTDWITGAYVYNRAGGTRHYPYSTNP